MTTTPTLPEDNSERQRSLRALDLLDVIKHSQIELTEPQAQSLRDVSALVQREVSRSAERRPAAPEIAARAHSITSGRILAAFGLLLALLMGVSWMTFRSEHSSIGNFRALVQAHETLEAAAGLGGQLEGLRALAESQADRLSNLLIASGVLRLLVIVLAALVLHRGVKSRNEGEESLRRSHEEAWSAAEDRRVAQAEAEKLGERLSAVLDHIDVGVTVIELDGSMTLYNMAAERIHGAWREQMERLKHAGTHPAMLADEKTVIPSGESPLGRALKGQVVRDAHIFFRTPYRPNGYHLNVSAIPLRNHQGLLAGAVLMFSERPS